MMTPNWFRPSALPRLARCPASGVESEGLPSPASDAGALGTAFHEIAAAWAMGMTLDVEHAARRHSVPVDELRQLAAALHAYVFDGTKQTERKVTAWLADGLEISGTADLVLIHDVWAEVVDVKTGNPDFADDAQFDQLAPYGIAVADELGHATVRLSLWYARLGAEGWKHRDIAVEAERERIAVIAREALAQEKLPRERRRYRVGEACTFCPARGTCAARTADLRTFTALAGVEPGTITAENVGAFDTRIRAVEKLVEAAKEARREFVAAHGGRVEIGDGYALVLRTEHRKEYTVQAGERETLRRVKA